MKGRMNVPRTHPERGDNTAAPTHLYAVEPQNSFRQVVVDNAACRGGQVAQSQPATTIHLCCGEAESANVTTTVPPSSRNMLPTKRGQGGASSRTTYNCELNEGVESNINTWKVHVINPPHPPVYVPGHLEPLRCMCMCVREMTVDACMFGCLSQLAMLHDTCCLFR